MAGQVLRRPAGSQCEEAIQVNLGAVDQAAQLGDGQPDHRAVVLLGVDVQPDGAVQAPGERIGVRPKEVRRFRRADSTALIGQRPVPSQTPVHACWRHAEALEWWHRAVSVDHPDSGI
ncbi:hypothetical protein [Streptomyces sp. NPDC005017]|uniref:hypothetical protein n=1 Tax=Streptomyces sp. NPDC005017 TaxID=3364706 RepID=UPI0036966E09